HPPGRPALASVPVHEAGARDARSRAEARSCVARRGARQCDAGDRLGPRRRARRGRRADDGAVAVPAADDDAGDLAVLVLGRRARRAGEPRRSRGRRARDRRLPQPRRAVRRLRDVRAAPADRVRGAADRLAHQAERPLRAQTGAAGMSARLKGRLTIVAIVAIVAVVIALLPLGLDGYHQGITATAPIHFIAILSLNILTGHPG